MKKFIVLVLAALLALSAVGAVTEEEAKALALSDAGVDTSRVKAEKDKSVFEVEFKADGIEYEYEIDISSGAIVKKGYELKNAPSSGKAVDQSEAEAIALRSAGLGRDDVGNLAVKSDYEDGRSVFEIDFFTASCLYEAVIDKATGTVLEYQEEMITGNAAELSIADAAALALSRVKGATEDDIHIKLDYDGKRPVYEGVVRYDGMEYEFEIDAVTGRFTGWEAKRKR